MRSREWEHCCMNLIENRTFDEIKPGETASLVRTLNQADLDLFVVLAGDINPAHIDAEYASSDMFHKIIAHGMWGASLISALLGTILPGPGTLYLSQVLDFHRPVLLGDTITVTVTAKEAEQHHVSLDCVCTNQRGDVVISGSAEVIAPPQKLKRPRLISPEARLSPHCHLHQHRAWYRHLLDL